MNLHKYLLVAGPKYRCVCTFIKNRSLSKTASFARQIEESKKQTNKKTKTLEIKTNMKENERSVQRERETVVCLAVQEVCGDEN